LVIDLTQYEKKTFFSFLGLYIGSVTILLSVIGVLFYQVNYEANFNSLKSSMKMESKEFASKIVMQDMQGVPKQDANLSHKGKYQVVFSQDLDKNKLPEGFTFERLWNFIDDTVYYLDKTPNGHYGIDYLIITDNRFLSSQRCLYEASFLFGGHLFSNDCCWIYLSKIIFTTNYYTKK
jgi:two-component system OmpR family sensor kinase